MSNRGRMKLGLLSCSSMIAALTAMPAMAQQPAADEAEEAASSSGAMLQDIVVTARRRSERLQDVPIAVSALSGADLQARGITTLEGVARSVPAFQMQATSNQKNNVAYTIRSQRQQESVLTQDLSVAVYFADVAIARSAAASGGQFDLSSVQVLKGAQGTLFGRNTTGGAVVVTPQAPTNEFEGYIVGRYGNYDQKYLEGVVNLPVSDVLQVRAGGQMVRRDGYVTNLFNGKKLQNDHTDSARLSIRLTPNENLRNDFVINYYNVDENGDAPRLVAVSAPATTLNPTLTAELARLNAAGRFVTNAESPIGTKATTVHMANTTAFEMGDVTLKNIAGYRRLKYNSQYDLDGTPLVIFPSYQDQRTRQLSDELQLLGKAMDDRLSYIIGAYYFLETGFERNGNAPLRGQRTSNAHVRNKSYSLFGQASYKILPNVEAAVGLRQTWDKRSIRWSNFSGAYNPAFGNDNPTLLCALVDAANVRLNPCTRSASRDFKKLTYDVSLNWHVTDDVLLYATHRLGYRAGGFNLRANTPVQAQPFAPETVRDYEIGLKTDWRIEGVRGRFNVAAYRQDYKDIQRQASIFVNGVFVGSTIQNAAKARIEGFEVEGSIQLTSTFEVGGFLAYSKPKYLNYTQPTATGSIDISRTPFAGAPRYSGGGSFRWQLPIASDIGKLVVMGDIYSQTGTYVQDGSLNPTTQVRFAQARIRGYRVANGRIELNEIGGSGFDAAFFMKNIANTKYYTSGLDLVDAGVGVTTRYLASPRTYGAELRYKF